MARYSATMMEHFNTPRNAGAIEDADATGKGSLDGRAPFLTMYLKVQQRVISQATFETFGCGASIASGSVLTEMITGRSLADCSQFTQQDVLDGLDGLPPEKQFCAGLAVRALQAALDNYQHDD